MKKATRTRRGRGDDRPAGGSAGRSERPVWRLRAVGIVPSEEGDIWEYEVEGPATARAWVIDRDEASGFMTLLVERVILKVPLLGEEAGAEEGVPDDGRPGSEGGVAE